jgi:glycosyltransferase involved in cell wall biosynthesis
MRRQEHGIARRGANATDYIPDPAVLLIEGSDFETFPAGGQLAMAQALMKLFGNRLALVGTNRDGGPTGCWTQKEILGTSYLFFPVNHRNPSGDKPFIPARLSFYNALRNYKKEILSLGFKAAFIQAPEALLAVSHWKWDSLCFWLPGVENPLKASRYPFAKPMARLFDKALFRALDHVSVILAAADENAISTFVSRSNGRLSRERLIQVLTCVDTSVFYPAPPHDLRAQLGIPANHTVFVSSGRISRYKGWELLLDAFEEFLGRHRDAFLFFVGDGEDRCLLQAQIERRDLGLRVKITGFQKPSRVASYLNAADVIVCGSMQEGWSVAMLEALGCGKAIVSTEVSGTAAMIKPGQNGFIVKTRNPVKFADAMEKALDLADAGPVSTSIASGFDLTRMGETLARVWPPFRAKGFPGTDQDEIEHCPLRPGRLER